MSCPAPGTKEYWQSFADFCRAEKAAGGPDPHVELSGYLVKDKSVEDRLWMGGCYVAVYNVAMAEVLVQEWPYRRIQVEPSLLEPWLEQNWHRVLFRRERRAARSPKKLASCLLSYSNWMKAEWPQLINQSYENFWVSTNRISTFGRYIVFKLLEYFARHLETATLAPDIRPIGADWPRQTLRELFPAKAYLTHGNTADSIARVNELATSTKFILGAEFGISLDYYQLEALLCEFRQMYKNHTFYPGRPQDSEFGYYNTLRTVRKDSPFLLARRALFPEFCLGEHNGWLGRRKELGWTLHNYGYVWSDALYDYTATEDLENPVRR